VSAWGPGSATVTASLHPLQASAEVTIRAVATVMERISGDGQTAAAGTALPQPLRVRVLDRHGSGVSGVAVAFSVSSGGGSIVPQTAATDAAGQAEASWTLGATPGEQQVRASSAGLPPLVFTATAGTLTNTAPVATIYRPLAGATFRAGDRITFTGGASDAEDGVLPPAQLRWRVDLHHDDHTHPFLSPTAGIDSGAVTIPTRGETDDDIWYRFYLTATDLQGATHTVQREILPEKAMMHFVTQPAGLRVTLDGQPRTAPLSVLGVVGLERDIGTVTPQTLDGQTYTFVSWSQGGAANQTIITPATETTYTATFALVQAPNQPPTVSLTAPAAGSNVVVNTAVTVSATASDSDGTVTQVEFFANVSAIGTDTTSPYSVQWTPMVTGLHRLTARATDNAGAMTTSDTVDVNVVPGGPDDLTPPTVQLTSPADRSQNLTGSLILTATASDNVGVAGVQFQVDGQNLGAEVTTPPYQTVLPSTSDYASGVHVIRARARDTAGNLSTWSAATVTFGGNQALGAGFTMTPFGSTLPGLATTLTFAPDGRLFVTLQGGQIRIVKNGTLLAREFARISVDLDGERGLLGLAFHPNFATNGWIYVHYLTREGGQPAHARIARLTASGDTARAGGPEVLVTFPTDEVPFHNGGAIHFGPDGKLYVAVGDDFTPAHSQSMSNIFGKMLRFNDDGTIPSDNPFFGSTSGLSRSIWALGLRNPFTFAFQPGTGRMFINDVGAGSWEEINEGVRGANYGWPDTEGPTSDPRFRAPLFAYPHSAANGLVTGRSIVGGAFYNPPVQQYPASYTGNYFFGDYVSFWIHRLDPANDNAVYRFASLPAGVTALALGPDGAVYVVVGSWDIPAQIYRIFHSP
jgi:glucose/arabinose dehydrogenase